jgi:hypothetical protein
VASIAHRDQVLLGVLAGLAAKPFG